MSWARENGGKRPTWVARRDIAKASRSAVELAELPEGTCLRFELPGGLRVTASKTTAKRWLVHSGGVDVETLAGLLAVEMQRRDM